ncbi:SgcJ/EcaC family oxidoreductase [Mycobacterium sp. MBM]|nr:SgcJ/EcaC family oxidoreductase [Mycobacterium sp. MBM]
MSEEVIREVLDVWRAGIDEHQPDRVAQVFTEDAIFQGLRPYSVGRAGVREYYASQPAGLTVRYRILETRTPAEGVVLGYTRADFTFADGRAIGLNLSILVTRTPGGWQIAHYQVSSIPD